MSLDVVAQVRHALQAFWDKGIKKVSPGALGMVVRGHPLAAEEGKWIADALLFTVWEPDLVDGWIVLTADPKDTPT